MPIHTLKLIKRHHVAANTIMCEFEKPDGLTFTPGQYGGFTLINPATTDAQGNTRRFSLLSTPDDEAIHIVTRLQSSAFKKNLNEMPVGSEIKFGGPTGNFILHEDVNTPAVLIAGGIGIAPFYSMIRHTCQHQPERELILIYGNQSQETAAFLEELTELAEKNKNFKFVSVLKDYITHTVIKAHVRDILKPIYYVCGAPVMVGALQETLLEMDIPPDQIKVEDFPGY